MKASSCRGLPKCPEKPAANARLRSSGLAKPVNAITGMACASEPFKATSSAYPSMPAMAMSDTMTSNRSGPTSERASFAPPAVVTAAPRVLSSIPNSSKASGSSSTRRRRTPCNGDAGGMPSVTPLAARGRTTVNVVPFPTPAEATATRPSCACVNCLTRARPIPRPPLVRTVDPPSVA
jgi:hypothetical protein